MKLLKKLMIATGVAAAGLTIAAKIKKPGSVYRNDESEQNPMEGKKVRFIEDENEPANADGVCGHLEAIGDSEINESFYEKYVKRGLDIALSFGGLVALSPVLLGLSAAIYIDDPGPILFTQKRIGKDKQYFKLHKFRSMKMSTPHDKPTHMLENPEQYITKVGKFIRAHSLDELPQLFNVLKGEMSLIGPRPWILSYYEWMNPIQKRRLNVRPGITGLAQVRGRNGINVHKKIEYDLEYVNHFGIKYDLMIIKETIRAVLSKENAEITENGIVNELDELKIDKNNQKHKGRRIKV